MPGPRRKDDILRAAGLLAFAFWLGLWVWTVIRDPDLLANRDWVAFDRAADHFRNGTLSEVYRSAFETDLLFLYPPFSLYLFLPLAWLPFAGSYVLAIGAGTAALVAGVARLGSALGLTARRFLIVCLVIAVSGWWITYLPTAQLGPLYFLSLALGLHAWLDGRQRTAGLWLSLLWMKPNLALVMLVLSMASRRWRVTLGMLGGLAVLFAVSIPLGLELWGEFSSTSRTLAGLVQTDLIRIERQITLFALLEWLLRDRLPPLVITGIWAVAVVPLGLATLAAWWGPERAVELPRRMGVAALFMLAGNPYLYFYDGLLLFLPAIAWYAMRSTYRNHARYVACGVLFVTAYLWTFALMSSSLPMGLVGVCAYAWLMIEAWDLREAARLRTVGGSGG